VKLLLLVSGAGGFGKIFRMVIVLCDAEMGGAIAALVMLGTSRNRNEEHTVCCSHWHGCFLQMETREVIDTAPQKVLCHLPIGCKSFRKDKARGTYTHSFSICQPCQGAMPFSVLVQPTIT